MDIFINKISVIYGNPLIAETKHLIFPLIVIPSRFYYLFSKKALARPLQCLDLVNNIVDNKLVFIFNECYLLSVFTNLKLI